MLTRKILPLLVAVMGILPIASRAAEATTPLAVVNFTTCISESKYGKKEQEALESVRKQMTTVMSDYEKQLQELGEKFQDADYLDSLSPEAEQEMKAQYQTLSEELGRYQNQYYQMMKQANMKLYQSMSHYVGLAAEKVSKEEDLSFVINKDACFYYNPKFEVTELVIKEMDNAYEKDHLNETAANETTQTGAKK